MFHALDPSRGVRASYEKHRLVTSVSPILAQVDSTAFFTMLDYDGTLSAIVSDPSKASLTPSMADAVAKVAKSTSTSIVSGRGKEKVLSFLSPLNTLILAGSHGFDILGALEFGTMRISLRKFVGGQEGVVSLAACRVSLAALLVGIRGAQVEDNLLSVTVHTRNIATVDDIQTTEGLVAMELLKYPDLQVFRGDSVIEIRPRMGRASSTSSGGSTSGSSSNSSSSSSCTDPHPTAWNKGEAVLYILSQARLILPIGTAIAVLIIGDDTTDEDMFKATKAEAATAGAGVGVGGGALQVYSVKVRRPSSAAVATDASFEVENLAEVEALLREWADLAPSQSKTLVVPQSSLDAATGSPPALTTSYVAGIATTGGGGGGKGCGCDTDGSTTYETTR